MRMIHWILQPSLVSEKNIHGKHITSALTFNELRKELQNINGIRCITTNFALYINVSVSSENPLWFDETQFKNGLLPKDYTDPLTVLIVEVPIYDQ